MPTIEEILNNPILDTDSYKLSQWCQYPPNTTEISSYIESRSEHEEIMFFGLQMYLKRYLSQRITKGHIEYAEEFANDHGEPFYREGWEYILKEYGGVRPLSIQAVPEGTVLPTRNVMVQVRPTDPNCWWLASYVETALLRSVWFPSTVTTNSWEIKQDIKSFMEKTSTNLDNLLFKLHDFGARGVSSKESAEIAGCAHLVNFMGSDTISGVLAARAYYGEKMAGFSIPATEHSTITSWGGPEFEIDAFRNLLDKFAKPGALVACVSDSYNIWEAIGTWSGELKETLINSGATLVIRPDSGHPVETPVNVVKQMLNDFGYRTNRKGYAILPDYIRCIQGDGVEKNTIYEILTELSNCKIDVDNIAFGSGGALLQKFDRDTKKFAMKASEIVSDGVRRDVYKDPVTDKGKGSKRGRLALIKNGGIGGFQYQTVREDRLNGNQNELVTVWENGKLLVDHTFAEIRERSNGNV
jgi:nicotinamide phosphoribosyltransferase